MITDFNNIGTMVVKVYSIRDNGMLKQVFRFSKRSWHMQHPNTSHLMPVTPSATDRLESLYQDSITMEEGTNVVKFPVAR